MFSISTRQFVRKHGVPLTCLKSVNYDAQHDAKTDQFAPMIELGRTEFYPLGVIRHPRLEINLLGGVGAERRRVNDSCVTIRGGFGSCDQLINE